jgi:hypothetical protein
MAKDETKRLKPSVLEADRSAFAALRAIDGYAPVNPSYTLKAISAAADKVDSTHQAEAQAAAAYDAARDDAVAAVWQFHNLMLGANDQVAAQFGRDSNQYQSLGKKKPSEFKPRARAAKKAQQ